MQASQDQPDDQLITIDRRQLGWTSVLADAGMEFPFKDQIFAHVFSSHLFEHLSFAQAEQCARSSYRVLKPFGTIRLYMPNLEYWVRCYQGEGMTPRIAENIYGQQKHPWDYHLSGWDKKNLVELVESVGFSGVAIIPGRSSDELCVMAVRL